MLLYFLQDVPHIELHTSYKGYLKNKGPHEVVKYLTAFPLEIDCLVIFKVM